MVVFVIHYTVCMCYDNYRANHDFSIRYKIYSKILVIMFFGLRLMVQLRNRVKLSHKYHKNWFVMRWEYACLYFFNIKNIFICRMLIENVESKVEYRYYLASCKCINVWNLSPNVRVNQVHLVKCRKMSNFLVIETVLVTVRPVRISLL